MVAGANTALVLWCYSMSLVAVWYNQPLTVLCHSIQSSTRMYVSSANSARCKINMNQLNGTIICEDRPRKSCYDRVFCWHLRWHMYTVCYMCWWSILWVMMRINFVLNLEGAGQKNATYWTISSIFVTSQTFYIIPLFDWNTYSCR